MEVSALDNSDRAIDSAFENIAERMIFSIEDNNGQSMGMAMGMND